MSHHLFRQFKSLIGVLVEGKKEYGRLQLAMVDLVRLAATKGELRSLLDVGCGQGGYTLSYAAAAGIPLNQVYGIEFNTIHLNMAQQRFVVQQVDLEAEPFPFADAGIEMVVCNQVLEHIKNVFWVLAEMDRVLSVGGIIAIGIPNLTSLINRAVLLAGRQPVTIGIEGPHVRGFAHASFREFLLRHPGYRLVAELGSSFYPWPAKLCAEKLARRLPALSAYTFYALRKQATVVPCPWLQTGDRGETSYTHTLCERS